MALEQLWRIQACHAKDLKTLDAILDDAFVHVDSEGRLLTKPFVLAQIKEVDSLQFSTESMDVKLHGQTAVVTGLYRMKLVEHGKTSVERSRFVDTWLNKNGRWMAVASVATPSPN